jgi:hypothetical protein
MQPVTEAHLPDYAGGSIANLMASIGAALNAPATGSVPLAHPGLANALIGSTRIVLLVLDGLGYRRLLTAAHARGALRTHLRGPLTSVFPSTTASAITTFLTGLVPARHGITGWHMWLRKLGTVGVILPYRTRIGDRPLTALGIEPEALFTYRTFFESLPVRSYVVSPERIVSSVYNRAHSRGAELRAYVSLEQLFASTLACLRYTREPCYIYGYYADYDSMAHEQGVASRQADALLQRFDDALGAFLREAAGLDATVIVTADHGFIDSPGGRSIELDRHPLLEQTLRAPLCGERRVAYCYVQPQAAETFERYIASELADRCWLHSSETLIGEGWFGPGPPHAQLGERIGDYVLVMKDNWTIKQWLPGEERHRQIGVHGGVSEDEMSVPLVISHV